MEIVRGLSAGRTARSVTSGVSDLRRHAAPALSGTSLKFYAVPGQKRLLHGKRFRTRKLKAGSDFDSQKVIEGQNVEVKEDAWRKRVREKVAIEIAEEKKLQEDAPGEQLLQGRLEASVEVNDSESSKIFNAITGSGAVLAVATTVTLITNAFGVDVFSRLHMPEDPGTFAQNCAIWTLPAMLGTAVAWNHIFFSEGKSELLDIFRDEAWDARDVVEGESVASMALSGILLALAEGIVFRGTGLALSADVFAGVSSFPLAEHQEAATSLIQLKLFPEYHLPVSWVWPSVVLGAAALEATVEAMAQGGVDSLDSQLMTEMLCKSIMTETMEVQYATTNREGSFEFQKAGRKIPLSEVSASGLARTAKNFYGQFEQQRRRQEYLYAGPGLILAKAVFLSAEAVLMDSLVAALITGAACEAVQSIISLNYIEKRIKSQD